MWKKINKFSMSEMVVPGKIITTEPNNDCNRYEIKSIENNYIRAIPTDGKVHLKAFPAEKLVLDNWWVHE